MNTTTATPRFFISPMPYGRGHEIRFGISEPDGAFYSAEPVEIKAYQPHERPNEKPMLGLYCYPDNQSQVALQSLMDELWRIGIRPSDIGTAGHLAATQAHLKDMQGLVEKFSNVVLSPSFRRAGGPE